MFYPSVPWPNSAKCAAAITFDCDADTLLHIAFPDDATRRVLELSWLRYDEVAIPHIVKMFDRYEIKQTFFIPAWCIEHYPHVMQTIVDSGHEIAQHSYIHESPNKLQTREAELYWLQRSRDVIEEFCGERPVGFRAPGGYSPHTTSLLAQEGFLYDSSLMNDSVPFLLRTEEGDVIELPIDYTMDDWGQFAHFRDLAYVMQPASPDRAAEVFLAEFQAAYEIGSVWITVWHPMVSGRPARLIRIAKMIEQIQSIGDVWFASLGEIARHVESCIQNGTYEPRVVSMPFYERGRVRELRPGHVPEEVELGGGAFP